MKIKKHNTNVTVLFLLDTIDCLYILGILREVNSDK